MSKRTRKQAPVSPVRTRSPRRSSVGWLILSVGIGGLTLTGLALLWRSANEAPIAETLSNALDTTAVSQAASSAETTTSDIAALPGLDAQRFDSVVRSVAEREDPTIDGWESERFSELADEKFKKIGQMLTDAAARDLNHAAAVAADSFRASRLRPTTLRDAFRDPSITVMRPADDAFDEPASGSGPQALLDMLAAQAGPLLELADQRFKFKTIRVDLAEATAQTSSYFQVSGRRTDRAVQINARWTCRWQRSGEEHDDPRLVEIDVEGYEEIVHASPLGPLFADCTESVFRNSNRFTNQLIYGIDHWTDRFDGAIARPAAGHGIAVGDVNGDGLEDVYLCQSPALPNLLLIQNLDGTVTDVAEQSGVNWLEGTRAALLVDVDNDGDQDLIAVLGSKVVIQANDGRGRFSLKTIVDTVSSLFAINAIDYDNDQDLDLFICGYTLSSGVNLDDVFANPMPFHDANNGAPNVMLRNEGDWSFVDVTKKVGLDHNGMRFSYASAWEDYDNDGDLDIYVANDFGRNNLYRNDAGQFRDVAAELDVEDIGPGMSAAWGDYNNDGRPDLYVSNMFSSAGNRITHQRQFKTNLDTDEKKLFQRHARGNSLFENVGADGFRDRSVDLGVTLGRWAWGSLFADLNNDGWDDIYVTNGFITADDNNDL